MVGVFSSKLELLGAQLPDPKSEDIILQTRAVLRLLVENLAPSNKESVPENPSTCPNCGASSGSLRSPYCSSFCREQAAFIRQFRNALAEETAISPEKQASLGQAFWHLLGGGYPGRQALVSEKARDRLLRTKGGLCELCGAPAETFDHTGSG